MKKKRKPTRNGLARGYIRKNREDILNLLWKCQTDFTFIDEDYDAWVRAFKSDRGNAVQILSEFFELVKKLYYIHKRRCSDTECSVKKDLWFRWRSLRCRRSY